ncbi:MAG: ATP-binding cassette domain-containing protein [Gemmatimonadaceae bacterium]|nr:ATP-binding cassette domain-containing protein [Gemmatimonadaceae bacterium]
MSSGQTIIKFTSVTKSWPRGSGGLQKVSFSAAKGEFVFLTGPSGAGKSTILKLSYMDDLPSSGEVRISGVSSINAKRTDISKLRRKLGIVFQDFRLLEDRTAWANVAFALEVTGTHPKAIPARVQKVLERVGLGPKMQSMPSELSGGEQQRVAIARALVNDPFVLLADEPPGNRSTAPAGGRCSSCSATSTPAGRRC